MKPPDVPWAGAVLVPEKEKSEGLAPPAELVAPPNTNPKLKISITVNNKSTKYIII